MKRILLVLTLIYCCGLVIGALVRFTPVYFLFIFAACMLSALYLFSKGRKIYCLIYLAIFSMGIFVSSHKLYMLEKQNNMFDKQHIILYGQISGDIIYKGNICEYMVYGDSIEYGGARHAYNHKIKVIDCQNPRDYIVPFNKITISGEFQGWKLYKNMYNFYCDRFMLSNDIHAVLLCDYDSHLQSAPSSARYVYKIAYGIRRSMEGVIDKYLDKSSSSMMKGMLFGDTHGLDEEDYEDFKNTGIVHIFSVSGYNIWLIYFILSIMLSFIKRHNTIKTASIICILSLYTIMSGGSPSVVRAFIMAAALLVCRVVKRKVDPLTSLALAAVIILLFKPLSILDMGFQLSFISVVSIILLLPGLRKLKLHLPDKIHSMIMVSLSVQIGMLPFILYHFNNFPILSIPANLVIIPLVSAFTVGGLILCCIGFFAAAAGLLGSIINILGRSILKLTSLMASIPYSNLNIISPSIAEVAAYYMIIAGSFDIIKLNSIYKKAIKYAAVIILLACVLVDTIPGRLSISFVDVGQGDCIYIETPDRKNILIDGGGKPDNTLSSIDIGEDILIPYLYRNRAGSIDVVVSTHSHDDHLKGLIPVIQSFDTGLFVMPGYGNWDGYKDIESGDIMDREKILDVLSGDLIKVGKYVTLQVISPSKEYHISDENDASVVIKLVYDDFSALFTGDITSVIQDELLGYDLKSDILKIPHHGSALSVNEAFLNAVNPDAAVICVGRNSYGHPSDTVIREIKERNIRLFRTDIDGEVVITTDGQGFEVRTAM